MYKGFKKCKFVCMDEISGTIEKMNNVIYNPAIKDKEFSKRILCDTIRKRFNVILTDEQTERLTSYDVDHLDDFIIELKQIIEDQREIIFQKKINE